MSLGPSNLPFNLERSLNRYLFENVGPTYKVYFSGEDGHGRGRPAILQLDCRSKISTDNMRRKLKEMRDFVIEAMNVNEIVLYDYADTANPVASVIPICPRWRGGKWGPNERRNSIAVYFLTYNLYVWRPEILP
jgi:hypothetical protein